MSPCTRWVRYYLPPAATLLAGIIVTGGACYAARTFQPMFVSDEGRFLWNLRNIVELQDNIDGKGCRLILSNAESILLPSVDASTQEQSLAAYPLGKKECRVLRRALEDYVIR